MVGSAVTNIAHGDAIIATGRAFFLMHTPLVTVVVETITARYDIAIGEKLLRTGAPTLQAAAPRRRLRGAPVPFRFATPPPPE